MSAEESKRIVALAMESADDAPTYRQFLTGAEVAISAALATARAEARKAALEEAAKVADAFEQENFAMCTDGIMNDPVLKAHRGDGLHLDELTEADWHKSEEHQTHSTIHSSMAHAARNIATAIRAMIAAVEEEAKS